MPHLMEITGRVEGWWSSQLSISPSSFVYAPQLFCLWQMNNTLKGLNLHVCFLSAIEKILTPRYWDYCNSRWAKKHRLLGRLIDIFPMNFNFFLLRLNCEGTGKGLFWDKDLNWDLIMRGHKKRKPLRRKYDAQQRPRLNKNIVLNEI